MLDHTGAPHLVETVVRLSPRPVLLAFRGTCTELRTLADKLLARHVVVVGLDFEDLVEVVTFSDGDGNAIPCLYPGVKDQDSEAEYQFEEWEAPPALELARVLDMRVNLPPGLFDPLACAATNVEVLRVEDEDWFAGDPYDYCVIVADKFVQGVNLDSTDNAAGVAGVGTVKVAHGVEDLVITVYVHGERTPKTPEVRHQHSGRDMVRDVTVIFTPSGEPLGALDPPLEHPSQMGVLACLVRDAARKLGEVNYTFVGVAEHSRQLGFHLNLTDGTPPPERVHRYVLDGIKDEAIAAGTWEGSTKGIQFLSRNQYRTKVGKEQYDLDTLAGWFVPPWT